MPGFTAETGRLDRLVATRLSMPRAEVQRAIAEGRVRVDGVARPKSFSLAGGERVEVELGGLGDVPAEGPAVPVRYEDDRLLVVAKPADMVTHPTASRRTGTLVNRLLGMGLRLSSVGGPERRAGGHGLGRGALRRLGRGRADEVHEPLARL